MHRASSRLWRCAGCAWVGGPGRLDWRCWAVGRHRLAAGEYDKDVRCGRVGSVVGSRRWTVAPLPLQLWSRRGVPPLRRTGAGSVGLRASAQPVSTSEAASTRTASAAPGRGQPVRIREVFERSVDYLQADERRHQRGRAAGGGRGGRAGFRAGAAAEHRLLGDGARAYPRESRQGAAHRDGGRGADADRPGGCRLSAAEEATFV
eukprot:ctg_3764.g405